MSKRIFDWKPVEPRAEPSSSRGKRTREAILRAALVVFKRNGFVNTTMQDIAHQAGIASGTTYQYFSDKSDVLRCILSTIEDRLYRETRMSEDSQGHLVVYPSVLRYLKLYREYAAAYGAWWELLVPHTEFTDAWVDTHRKFRDDIKLVIERGQRSGSISEKLDVEIGADLIVAMFERPAYLRVVLGWEDGIGDEEVATVVGAMLGSGLAATGT